MNTKPSAIFHFFSTLIGISLLFLLIQAVTGEKQPYFLIKLDQLTNKISNWNRYKNFIKNPSFETDTNNDNFPDHWHGTNITLTNQDSHDQHLAIQTKSDITFTNQTNLWQTINFLWPENTKLNFTGWIKADNLTQNKNTSGIHIQVHYINNQTSEFTGFPDPTITTWQPISVDLQLKHPAKQITITAFFNQTGTAYFDHFSLQFTSAFTPQLNNQ